MDTLTRLRAAAAKAWPRIVLPEGEDPRIQEAADRLAKGKLARPILIGNEAAIREQARQKGLGLLGCTIVDPAKGATPERVQACQLALALANPQEAKDKLTSPVTLAACMVRIGEAEAGVGGAVHTTADILRAGIKIVGLAEGVKTVSSFFLMELPGPPPRLLFFADCGVVPAPTPPQLADIGVTTAKSFARLTGETPRTAFLAFSTKGSAAHPTVDAIRGAVKRAQEMAPGLAIDGELQADAALVAAVGERKAPGSPVAGKANVLIFPDLHSGNIGYKLVERLAGAKALGPIVQGLAKPFCDLSRGASAGDVVDVAVIAAVLSGNA